MTMFDGNERSVFGDELIFRSETHNLTLDRTGRLIGVWFVKPTRSILEISDQGPSSELLDHVAGMSLNLQHQRQGSIWRLGRDGDLRGKAIRTEEGKDRETRARIDRRHLEGSLKHARWKFPDLEFRL